MKGLFWNYCGLGSPQTINSLKSIIQIESPIFVFLSETKMKSWELEMIKKQIKMDNGFAISCIGEGTSRKGGLALLWRNEAQMEIIDGSLNFIDSYVQFLGGVKWRLTRIYGCPEEEKRSITCDILRMLNAWDKGHWICGGDFNLMMRCEEKKNRVGCNINEVRMFREYVEECELLDLGFVGYEYTWNNNRPSKDNTQERLDRILANAEWKNYFRASFVSHLPKSRSDHLPLVLHIQDFIPKIDSRRKRKIYRFEKMWFVNQSVNKLWKRSSLTWGG